eukprot:COSAG02_NODE_44281_length_367_cov_1.373134_1_plen_44_part_10
MLGCSLGFRLCLQLSLRLRFSVQLRLGLRLVQRTKNKLRCPRAR